MKKKIISVMATLVLMFAPMFQPRMQAQILIMDEEEEEDSERTETEESELELPAVPELGITIDQYAPLGGEILVLGCRGGAYLLGKRKKKEQQD